MEKFYLTTAIAYASRKPHIGNTYEIIMADAFARFQKSQGKDVFLCTGTDEHGQKIENLASEAGITPKAYVDRVAGEIKGLWDLMGVEYDHFIRTTDDYHEKVVAKIFKKFYEQGDIYKGYYEGWYCTPCESFFTATQAANGICPDCGRPVSQAKEEAYFFKMSKYADRLIKHIEDNPGFIEPESRKREMVNNFLKAGLQDLCVSRTSFTWGIPVTFDPKHVTYVWLDALTNYITAIGYDPDKSFEEQSEKFKKYWPADVHIIGKDILRFHTIYWPIFLMALDLPLPKKVFGHPWFNFGNDKMSKSKGNVVYADELAESFGVDAVRYYALSEMPYNSDGSVTYESVIARYNNDLANNLGNLVSRTHAMTKKYFDGIIPAPDKSEDIDLDLQNTVANAITRNIELMNDYHVADSLEVIFNMLRRANIDHPVDKALGLLEIRDVESQPAAESTALMFTKQRMKSRKVLKIGKRNEHLRWTEHHIAYPEALALGEAVLRAIINTEHITLFNEMALAVHKVQGCAVQHDGKLVKILVDMHIIGKIMVSVLYEEREAACPRKVFKCKALHIISLSQLCLFLSFPA